MHCGLWLLSYFLKGQMFRAKHSFYRQALPKVISYVFQHDVIIIVSKFIKIPGSPHPVEQCRDICGSRSSEQLKYSSPSGLKVHGEVSGQAKSRFSLSTRSQTRALRPRPPQIVQSREPKRQTPPLRDPASRGFRSPRPRSLPEFCTLSRSRFPLSPDFSSRSHPRRSCLAASLPRQ